MKRKTYVFIVMLCMVLLMFCACTDDNSSAITISEISGIISPVLGEIPVTIITETTEYTGTVSWDGGWSWSQYFGGNKEYTATITLTPKSGYTLTGVKSDFFIIAGATASNPVNSGVITASFPATTSVSIGDDALGGKIAYILQSGDPGYIAREQRGLVAASADQSAGIQWGGSESDLAGTGYITELSIGSGKSNTETIVNFFSTIYQSDNSSISYYAYDWTGLSSGSENFTDGKNTYAMSYENNGYVAAKLCVDYVVVDGSVTYDDWFLPSKDELNKLTINRNLIGGFTTGFYWCSSEVHRNYCWSQYVTSNKQLCNIKTKECRVRAVRAF